MKTYKPEEKWRLFMHYSCTLNPYKSMNFILIENNTPNQMSFSLKKGK